MNLFASLMTIKSTKKEKVGTSSSETVKAVAESSDGSSAEAEVFGTFGTVTRPPKGTRCIRLRIGALNIIISAFRYDVAPPDNPGEVKHYSTDEDGVVKSQHVLTADGKHVFNEGEDFAVRFSAMETAFNSLKDSFNAHTHPVPGVTPGPGSTTSSAPSSTSAADISGAKVEEIQIP